MTVVVFPILTSDITWHKRLNCCGISFLVPSLGAFCEYENSPYAAEVDGDTVYVFHSPHLAIIVGNIITGQEIKNACNSTSTRPVGSSSNQFASGTLQNIGNVITDRRMIRVNAPPGGRSSFSISTMFSN